MLDANDPHGSLVGVTLGNYRVGGRIGAGGMGVVYRAKDVRLDRTVAVKALPEAAGSDPVARRRLMDEARRGSQVVSPYAATVFDVVEQDDRAYIVMEYIEGRRLDVVLREDHPDINTVTGFAIEIAEALTAIHAAGLVHKDLKPANVMITPAGHVKVMDFGLAREDASALLQRASTDATLSTLTLPGGIAGTILYMSPEQVRGEALDARSDLFSFGTLLYEAVTGAHPFERESILASASAILHEAPSGATEPQQLAASPVAPIVNHLLEKDRDRRYSSAQVVLQDLRAARAGATVLPKPEPAPEPKPKPLGRRIAVFAVAAVAVATIVIGGFKFWPSRPPTPVAGTRPVLAVLPFEDKTGEPKGDLRAQLLADLIATDLAESSLVRALPSDRVREILVGVDVRSSQKPAMAAVSKAADVKWIVAGALYQDNDTLYASVGIYQPGEPEPSQSFRAQAGTTAAIAEIASVQLRERLFPDQKDDRTPGALTARGGSSSEEAMLLEQEAKKAFRELRYGEAIENLDKAVRLDPGFLRAQVHLAEALDRAGYAKRARETADRALRTAEQLGAPFQGDSLALETRAVHSRIRNDAEGEIAARRALVERHGDDPTAHLELARALDRRGHSTEALPEADLAIALDDKDPGAHVTKARLFYKDKRFDEALAELNRAESAFAQAGSAAGRATIDRVRGDLEYKRAKFPQAEEFYQKAARAFSATGLDLLAAQALKAAGDCESKRGNLDAAVAIYEPVLAAARSAGDPRTIIGTLSSLGAVYIVRGDNERAERVLREARAEALGLDNPALLAGPTLNLASVLGNTDRVGESRVLAEEALALARDVKSHEIQAKALLLLANVQYHEGRLAEAIQSYREVLDSPPLASASGTPLGNGHLGLAQILRESGRLKDALESAEQAVSVARAAEQSALLGYALVERARVRTDLVIEAGANGDLDEAAKLAADPAAPLDDLRLRVALGRAAVAMSQARWDAADRILAPLRYSIGPKHTGGLDAVVLAMSAQVAIETGRTQDAIRFARQAIENPTAFAVDSARSRVELARSCGRSGDKSSALSEAQRALSDADRIGLPIATALACAILVELGEGGDIEALRARGRSALESYLDAAPEDRRDAMQARSDLQLITRMLEPRESVNRAR